MDPSTRHLREPPPRHVGFFTVMSVLFGGFFQTFGWFFVFLGSIFCWIFIPSSEARFWFEKKNNWLEAPGTVLSAERTNATENEAEVFHVMATFEVDGETFIAHGYVNGGRFQGGESVTVKYAADDPGQAFITRTKRAVFGKFVAFVLIFPLVGLCLVTVSFWKNLKSLRLLVNGIFTRGKLQKKTPTLTQVNKRTVFQYEFEFSTGGKKHKAICKTHLYENVEDEEKEIILYNPHRPAFNVVYDAAPMPAINEHGHISPAIGRGLLCLLLPALTVAMNWFLFTHGLPFSAG